MTDKPLPLSRFAMREPLLLDFCAGVGGFSLAFEAAGFRTIGFSEVDPYPCAVLAHHWPGVPNLGPIQSVTRDSVLDRCGITEADLAHRVVVSAGFPCTPHSMAGKRGASADERDLWPECWRILRDLRPRFALFENVAGLLTSESGAFFNRVLSDLAAIRYACQWHVVSAADVGAPHRRERVWLLCVDERAYGDGLGRTHGQPRVHATERGVDALGDVAASGDAGLADGGGAGLQGRTIRGRDSGDGTQSDDELAGGRYPGGRACWPAASGHWPARPGERQFGWESPRTVNGKLNPSWVEHLLGVPNGHTQLPEQFRKGGAKGPRGGNEAVRVVRGDDGAQDIPERQNRTARDISRSALLQPDLLRAGRAQGEPRDEELSLASAQVHFHEVRDLWDGGDATGASPRQESGEQQAGEPDDALPIMPHEVALDTRREAEVPSVFCVREQGEGEGAVRQALSGVSSQGDAVNRVHRLRALGNGIVPAVAFVFAQAIADQLAADESAALDTARTSV